MTEIEILRRRRKLVVLSADVQRATVMHRVNNLDASPLRLLYGFATNVTRFVAMRRIALGVFSLAVRMMGRRARRT